MGRVRYPIFLSVAIAALPSSAQLDQAPVPPRPLSAAEIASTHLVLDHFAQGPAAWRGRLAPRSPLASLSPSDFEARIALATGPIAGSLWSLATPLGEPAADTAIYRIEHASGLDQLLALRFVEQGGRLALTELSTWGDPAPSVAPATPAPAPGVGVPSPDRPLDLASAMAIVAFFGTLVAGGWLAWRRRTIPSLLLAGVGSLAIGAIGFVAGRAIWGGGPPARRAEIPTDAPSAVDDSWRAVASLSSALFSTGDFAGAERFLAAAKKGSAPWTRMSLALAQAQIEGGRLEAAAATLARLGANRGQPPLAEVLRARIARARGDVNGAELAYRNLGGQRFDSDALALERHDTLAELGAEDEAVAELERIANGGSREAIAHFLAARLAIIRGANERALALFRVAWSLAPLEREVAIGDPAFAYLLREGNLLGGLELGSAAEPRPATRLGGRTPLAIPAGFQATACGEELLVEGNGATLRIPGAGELLPAETQQEDAETRARRQERDVLDHLDALERLVSLTGRIAEPGVRRRLRIAVGALARQNRWPEILALTSALGDRPQDLPSEVAQLRAEALYRRRRPTEAARLLVAYAQKGGIAARHDPAVYFRLGLLLKKLDQYELAARAIQKAQALSPFGELGKEVQKIRLDQTVGSSYDTIASEHFAVRYPREHASRYFDRLAAVFETEYRRLRTSIPGTLEQPIVVDLYPFERFAQVYSQGEFIGLFDGKVRLPFANLQTLHPIVLSVMSHEIGHAMLAQATHDNAPHWFQEGVAQHVQPLQEQINPLPDYERRGALLSIRMVEVPLATPSDPELRAVAYDVSAWAIHFLVARHGLAGLHRMIAAYRDGLDTDRALARALGTDAASFDRALLAWSKTSAGASHTSPLIRYDLPTDPGEGLRRR